MVTKTLKTTKTTDGMRKTIVEFLQIPANFRLITGAAAQNTSVVAGKKLTNTAAYKELATIINSQHNTEWDSSMAKNRYEAYIKCYRATKKTSEGTGK